MAKILISATQNAFRGRVPDRCLEWITPEESAANWVKYLKSEEYLAGEGFLFVIEAPHLAPGVIGLALLAKRSDSAVSRDFPEFSWELRSLQVDPAWQRQGIGRHLVSYVAEQAWQGGARHLLVRVLAENPNRAFYERLGARQWGAQPYDWEGYETEEILYGWGDINSLRNAA